MIGVAPEEIAKLHMFYRSSVTGRRDIGKQLATTIKTIKDFKKKGQFTNRNVEILQAYLKSMGLRIEFLDDMYNIPIYSDHLESFETDTLYLISTRREYEDVKLKEKILKKYQNDVCFVGTSEEFSNLIETEFEDAKRRRDNYVIDIKI